MQTATPTPTVSGTNFFQTARGNLLRNSSFDDAPGSAAWALPWGFSAGAGSALVKDTGADGTTAARIDVPSATPSSVWSIQLYQMNLAVAGGTPVTISFLARAAKSRVIGVAVNGTNFQAPAVALTTSWQSYSFTFTPSASGTVALVFHFGQDTGSVWLDAVSFGTSVPIAKPIVGPTATPTVTPAPTAPATPTVTPTPTATRAATPTVTPTPTPTASPTPTATPTASPTPTATPTASPTATPTPAGTILHGVTTHPAPWDMTALTAFEATAGKRAALVSYFVGYQQNNPPETATLAAIQARGALPMITWEWSQLGQGGLAATAAGAYDADIDLWARVLAGHPGPVLLRWSHEMNGTWYPWSVGVNGNTAADYVNAYRRIVSRFRAAGATNVQFVWSPNIARYGGADFTAMYPGDASVDWLGLDGYNWATRNPWQSFSQLFQSSYAAITALSTRPLMIAEWGSTEQGGDKGAWLRSALQTEIPTSFPRIKAVVYFNQNYEEDWRIASSPGAQAGYAAGVAAPVYRAAAP